MSRDLRASLRINPRATRQFLIQLAEALHAFGIAQHQHAIRRQGLGQPLQHRHARGAVEMHQHIAAEHQIQIVQPAIAVQQVELTQAHHPLQPVGNHKAAFLRQEMARHIFFR
jgi:hypothetical protein